VVPTSDGKYIGEHFGNASENFDNLSLAHMKAPANWTEPFQCPEFSEYTLVISGKKTNRITGRRDCCFGTRRIYPNRGRNARAL
jgi:hypothetical protein